MPAEQDELSLPGDLLQAAAQRSGRITLVVGAGCSLEAPTKLKLGSEYAKQAFEQLVADNELSSDACDDPIDLSQLATAVVDRHGTQRPLVSRLPLDDFRFAKANDGYLLAAALMAEGAVAYVATLNFDLALSNAITQVRPSGVKEVAGPESLWNFGSQAIIYLHRNVNESNPNLWILRSEAIETEWKSGWEGVVAGRLAASPVVVFAGLGSPAAALSETLKRVRKHVPDATQAFVVDPAATTPFSAALELDSANHIRAGWGDFMAQLAKRVALQFILDLRAACEEFATEHGFIGLDEGLERLFAELPDLGLLGIGALRSQWLGKESVYEPDDPAYRPHVADLCLGIALLVESPQSRIKAHKSGVITVTKPGNPARSLYPISGCGHHHWATLDPLVGSCRAELTPAPDVVLAAGYRGTRPEKLVPPLDITGDATPNDIAGPNPCPALVDIDELRTNPSLITEIGL
jgi:hypothetical protein